MPREMKNFVLPFKPEELLAQPSDDRLWAADLPPVDDWSPVDVGGHLDELVGRICTSNGRDIAQQKSFSLIFALIQAWPRLDEEVRSRVVDLLIDAARRDFKEVAQLKQEFKGNEANKKEQAKETKDLRELLITAQVAIFFLRWSADRVLSKVAGEAASTRRAGKGAHRGNEDKEAQEEAKEKQKTLEKQRCMVLTELVNLLTKGAMPWLWMNDAKAWQQLAQAVSDSGFLILDNEEAMKHRETKLNALRCISEPLLQEGHQHSNLLVTTVSKLMHGLRGVEGSANFAAEALLHAHSTPLPRLFLVDLTQHVSPQELTSQGAFQRSLAAFLVAVSEKLPHLVLANISILLPLLDVDCYPLRMAMVEGIGQLLLAQGKKLPAGARCAVAADEQGADDSAKPVDVEDESGVAAASRPARGSTHFALASATKTDLLETLMTRSLDKSVWVRYRALQTLTTLASTTRATMLPKEQWARVLGIATRRMQDQASTTRKAAMQLVRALIEFHPYGPALQGSGDERAKTEQLLKEVHSRFLKLQAEEAAEAEKELAAAEGKDDMVPLADEGDVPATASQVDDTQTTRKRLKKKTVTEQTITGEVERCLAAEEGNSGERREERERQRQALKRMQDCYTQRFQFVELIDSAEERLRKLLMSRTQTDVTEAIGVVVELRLRGVPAAAQAFNQVLGLVWSKQAAIKDAAVDAFYRMHLEGRDAGMAVRNLLEMYEEGCSGGGWTYTHLASVQELIQQAAEKELIDPKKAIPELIKALDSQACSMALRTLIAFGAHSKELAAALPRILQLMGPDGTVTSRNPAEQLERIRLLCQLLQRLQSCARVPLGDECWSHIWALSQHATCIVIESFATAAVPPEWFGAAQAAMDLSFDLSLSATENSTPEQRCPDKLWEQILHRMLCGLLGQRQNMVPLADGEDDAMADAEGGADEPMHGAVVPAAAGSSVATVSSTQLGCVVFVAGHLGLRMIIYLEGLQAALKRKRLAEEDKRMEEQKEKNKQMKENKKKTKKGKGKGKEDKEEEDDEEGADATSMGMAGQEEREAEAFAQVTEHALLYGKRSLLDRVKPMILACLCDTTLRKDPILRRLGAISLCKFMTISKRFCEENLQLCFSVLFPKARNERILGDVEEVDRMARDAGSGTGCLLEDLTLRQSLLVAVGDLLFRHPNVVEPWTGKLYATLGQGADGSDLAGAEFRLTALLVLTHLVLNDMMKPRAVLLVRALWLTACPHDPTARVARILFQELAKRSSNILYNLIPEIIARLPEYQGSRVEGGAEGRVQYAMQFIEKEKHIEGLIEKFTIRLEQAANIAGGASGVPVKDEKMDTDAMDKEDKDKDEKLSDSAATVSCLSHAIGSMNYTDRCVIRLHDAVVVRKALHTAISYFPVTRECLLGIVEKARKPKPGKAGDAPPPDAGAEAAPAAEGNKRDAAAASAIDAIEKTVNALAKGKEEATATKDEDGRKPQSKKKENLKKEEAEPGFEDEKPRRGKGRGRGKEKENQPAPAQNAEAKGRGNAAAGAGKKRRAAACADDDEA